MMLTGLLAGVPQPSAELEGPFPSSLRATASLLIFLDPPVHSTTEDLVTIDEILGRVSTDLSMSSIYILLRAAC